jgi:hypothetical protein
MLLRFFKYQSNWGRRENSRIPTNKNRRNGGIGKSLFCKSHVTMVDADKNQQWLLKLI